MALPVLPYFRGILAVWFMSSTLLATQVLAVTPEEKAGARAAAQAGGEAFQAGRYQQAIEYFNRAESIIHAPPHLLYIARSELQLGHLVAAREAYMKIIHEELADNAPRVFKDAQTDAQRELDELEPRIPLVTAMVEGGDGREVTVFRDGVELPAALVGIPIPTDPGGHSFQAKARGLASPTRDVKVREGEKANVVLKLVPTGEPMDDPAAAAEPGAGEATEATPPATQDHHRSRTAEKILGYTGLVLGAGGLAVGTGFVLAASDTQAASNLIYDTCRVRPGGCTPEEITEINTIDDQALTQRITGYTSLAVGGVLLATGVTLLIVGYKSKGHAAPTTPKVWPVVGLSSIGLAGRF